MKLSSYVITDDYGFAPNPFGGALTLATCKPDIRRNAQQNVDWLMGTGSTKGVGIKKLIFAGKITSVIPIEEYGSSEIYNIKIPTNNGEPWQRRGDNIYYKDENGTWVQRKNLFHNEGNFDTDIEGKNAIICDTFWYFGKSAPTIPAEFDSLIKSGSKHKNNVGNPVIPDFLNWVQSFSTGIHDSPSSIKA